jgi:phosphoribosyl 1,2-cyclic phosphodiesterase
VKIKLWGVRGSIPTPLSSGEYRERLKEALTQAHGRWQSEPELSPETVLAELSPEVTSLVGGETTCVEVLSGEHQLIIDLGTGARRLGYDMLARGIKGDVQVLVTHTHWDHIQGWPFFVPGYIPDNTIHFYSCLPNCRERFQRQQHFDHFPVEFDEMMSKKEFHTFPPGGSFTVGPFEVSTLDLAHPGGSVAYKIEADGQKFIFATDTEFSGEDLDEQIDRYRPFFDDADLLIMDAQYTMDEARQKIGWGHTAMVISVDCALKWHVKRLVLTHHEPAYQDEKIHQIFHEARRYLDEHKNGHCPSIAIACENDVFEL